MQRNSSVVEMVSHCQTPAFTDFSSLSLSMFGAKADLCARRSAGGALICRSPITSPARMNCPSPKHLSVPEEKVQQSCKSLRTCFSSPQLQDGQVSGGSISKILTVHLLCKGKDSSALSTGGHDASEFYGCTRCPAPGQDRCQLSSPGSSELYAFGSRGTGAEGGTDGLGLLLSGSVMPGTLQSENEALMEASQRSWAALKQEPLDDFSPSEDELFQHHYHQHHVNGRMGHHPHPPRSAMPPPYHLHQYMGPSPGGLHHQSQQTAPASSMGIKQPPQPLLVPQTCRPAAYDQQEELVRHIEKVHIDQRKGEDFTCFWAGCIRRYKPFNARYKLLIHMRVHSGEKPNKCMVSLEQS
ncbi:hypothetical protein WMY93_024457 [Mugilogobius chulae]|uniref:C2H2-type domain-containing protein n=1 Tax=Mugilogobius chulae TaxID=88201 RepID=A0AAW0NAP0_9GOBI